MVDGNSLLHFNKSIIKDISPLFIQPKSSTIILCEAQDFFFFTKMKINDNRRDSLTSRYLQCTPLPMNLKQVVIAKDQLVLPQILGFMATLHGLRMGSRLYRHCINVAQSSSTISVGKKPSKQKRLNQVTYWQTRGSSFASHLLFYFTLELHTIFNKSLPLLFS